MAIGFITVHIGHGSTLTKDGSVIKCGGSHHANMCTFLYYILARYMWIQMLWVDNIMNMEYTGIKQMLHFWIWVVFFLFIFPCLSLTFTIANMENTYIERCMLLSCTVKHHTNYEHPTSEEKHQSLFLILSSTKNKTTSPVDGLKHHVLLWHSLLRFILLGTIFINALQHKVELYLML